MNNTQTTFSRFRTVTPKTAWTNRQISVLKACQAEGIPPGLIRIPGKSPSAVRAKLSQLHRDSQRRKLAGS